MVDIDNVDIEVDNPLQQLWSYLCCFILSRLQLVKHHQVENQKQRCQGNLLISISIYQSAERGNCTHKKICSRLKCTSKLGLAHAHCMPKGLIKVYLEFHTT